MTRRKGVSERTVIAGAGPAGSSLAIRLARSGRDVCLIEKARFPRHKLCGEFISPECLEQFRDLGILGEMESAGGDRIGKTVFYSMGGRSAEVPSEWFGAAGGPALGLSRSEMDHRLLEAAKRAGVEVLEGVSVSGAVSENGELKALTLRNGSHSESAVEGDIFVDATGRQRILARFVEKEKGGGKKRVSNLIGFKAHLKGVDLAPGVCEIYSFPHGYGGLNFVEGGAANHCFLVSADAAREFGSDADRIMRELIFRNERARKMMERAEKQFDWLAVAVDGFGAREPVPAPNLFTVGDSAAFIDPFTGSGMLMALESAELLANVLLTSADPAIEYQKRHARRFRSRLLLCSVIRRCSLRPGLASLTVTAAGLSRAARRILAISTRTRGARRVSRH